MQVKTICIYHNDFWIILFGNFSEKIDKVFYQEQEIVRLDNFQTNIYFRSKDNLNSIWKSLVSVRADYV